jgi:hypothetical protein
MRTVRVTQCNKGDRYSKDDAANMLSIDRRRVKSVWVEREGNTWYLFANITD